MHCEVKGGAYLGTEPFRSRDNLLHGTFVLLFLLTY